MSRARQLFTIMTVGLAGVVALSGCQNPDRIQLQVQADEINRLQDENRRLRGENDALRRRASQDASNLNAYRDRIAMLEQQNAALQAQIAELGRPREVTPPTGDDWIRSGEFSWLNVGTDMLFDSGRATLKPQARETLRTIAQALNSEFLDRTVLIIGHTDTDPIQKTKHLWHDNLDLSVNRAMAVFHVLREFGVDPQRMVAAGQGEYFPIASNATKAGKASNRRVTTMVIPPMPMQPFSGGTTPPAEPAPATEGGPTK